MIKHWQANFLAFFILGQQFIQRDVGILHRWWSGSCCVRGDCSKAGSSVLAPDVSAATCVYIPASFCLERWSTRMKVAHVWGDTALLHGIACAFKVDVAVLMNGSMALVGQSLMDDAVDDCEFLGMKLWGLDLGSFSLLSAQVDPCGFSKWPPLLGLETWRSWKQRGWPRRSCRVPNKCRHRPLAWTWSSSGDATHWVPFILEAVWWTNAWFGWSLHCAVWCWRGLELWHSTRPANGFSWAVKTRWSLPCSLVWAFLKYSCYFWGWSSWCILREALPQEKKYQRAERALRACKSILGSDCPMLFNQSRAARMRHSLRFQAYCDLANISKAISEECSKGKASHECVFSGRHRSLWEIFGCFGPACQSLNVLRNSSSSWRTQKVTQAHFVSWGCLCARKHSNCWRVSLPKCCRTPGKQSKRDKLLPSTRLNLDNG